MSGTSFVTLPSFLVCVYSLTTSKIILRVLEWRLPPYLKDCTDKMEGHLKKKTKHLKILQLITSGREWIGGRQGSESSNKYCMSVCCQSLGVSGDTSKEKTDTAPIMQLTL